LGSHSVSSLKFFPFDFRPSSAESRGLALCPASILVLKDLIFSWQDFLVQIAISAQVLHGLVSLHLGLRHHLILSASVPRLERA
jgi:hypothetical protein